MLNTFKNIILLGLIVGTVAFSRLVPALTEFVGDFNKFVIAFLPPELLVFVYIVVFLVLIKIYQGLNK